MFHFVTKRTDLAARVLKITNECLLFDEFFDNGAHGSFWTTELALTRRPVRDNRVSMNTPAMGRDDNDAGALDALCQRLRGEHVVMTSEMVSTARRHRIHLVLAAAARAHELSADAAVSLRSELHTAEMIEMMRGRTLRRLLDQLSTAGIETLLLKGAGLAYTLYPSACLRPREDADILIRRADLEATERALSAGGWGRFAEPDAELASTQRHYDLAAPAGFAERLDLHWKIAIPQLFADAVTVEALMSRSVPVTVLGPAARTLSTVDALFVACVHRVAHHQDVIELLWLWDIHLLASRLSVDERASFVTLATRASMRAVCSRGLILACARFQTAGALELISALRLREGEPLEPSARFLSGNLRQVDLLRSDLSALRGWHARVALVSEHLFPSVAYMRSMYPRCPAAVLPLAYAHRIVRGAPKWFRRPGAVR